MQEDFGWLDQRRFLVYEFSVHLVNVTADKILVSVTNQMKKKRRNIGLTPLAMSANGGFKREIKNFYTKPSQKIAEKRYNTIV